MLCPDAPALLCLPLWTGGSGWGGDWDTGGHGVHGSGCICPHAAGRDKQFRIGEYTWKCSPSGRNGNPVILRVRLAVIRQDQKGGHERADGGIIKHMERRMGKTGNNKKHYKGVP